MGLFRNDVRLRFEENPFRKKTLYTFQFFLLAFSKLSVTLLQIFKREWTVRKPSTHYPI